MPKPTMPPAMTAETLRARIRDLRTDAAGLSRMLTNAGLRGCDERAVRRMTGAGVLYDDVAQAIDRFVSEGRHGPVPQGAVRPTGRR